MSFGRSFQKFLAAQEMLLKFPGLGLIFFTIVHYILGSTLLYHIAVILPCEYVMSYNELYSNSDILTWPYPLFNYLGRYIPSSFHLVTGFIFWRRTVNIFTYPITFDIHFELCTRFFAQCYNPEEHISLSNGFLFHPSCFYSRVISMCCELLLFHSSFNLRLPLLAS